MQVILRQSFGLEKLRPGQQKAVETLLSGRDLLCVLPTGAGKSLCYQLPAMLHEGTVLVISPLIALMRDQIAHLAARGIPAVSLDSTMDAQTLHFCEQQAASGRAKLVYVSPERLGTASMRRIMTACPPWMVVVDEAHCVVQWGGSFRPAYQQIAPALAPLPQRPVICALTATADRRMQEQLIRNLAMTKPRRIVQPIRRENLHYQAVMTTAADRWIAQYVHEHPRDKGVVFCRSRAETEYMAGMLRHMGIRAEHYHAGLEREERSLVQQRFSSGGIQVLACTSAFGMGVDLPDIRYVIQTYLNDNLTDYVQQAGRAGRDGQSAECIQLITPRELNWYRHELQRPHGLVRRVKTLTTRMRKSIRVHRVLRHFLRSRCLSAGLSRAFGQHEKACGVCSACIRRVRGKRTALAVVPPLHRWNRDELTIWALTVVRNNLAAERGVPQQSIMPGYRLVEAARTGRFHVPLDDEAALRLNRCLNEMTR